MEQPLHLEDASLGRVGNELERERVQRVTGLDLVLNELWIPDTAMPRPQPNEPEPQRPNREQRRRMKKALRRNNDGSAKR